MVSKGNFDEAFAKLVSLDGEAFRLKEEICKNI